MTVTELATTFTAVCAEGKFEEPGQSYWSDAIVSVEPMDSARITMDEHALNTVKDGKVEEDRFFYANYGIDFGANMGAALSSLASYPNLVATKEPVLDMNIQGWTKKGSAIVVNTPADLKKFKIGLMRGAKAPEALIAGLKIEDAQSANSMELLSKMLDGGRFDIAVVTSAVNSAPLKEVGTVVAPKLASVQAFHLVHKNNADLAAKWDAILVAMKKDGRFAKLLTAH